MSAIAKAFMSSWQPLKVLSSHNVEIAMLQALVRELGQWHKALNLNNELASPILGWR